MKHDWIKGSKRKYYQGRHIGYELAKVIFEDAGYTLTEPLIEVCPKCKKEPCNCVVDRGSFAKYI